MTDPRKSLNILAPTSAKPKLDYLHRQLYRDAAERSGLNRRELLSLGTDTFLNDQLGVGRRTRSGQPNVDFTRDPVGCANSVFPANQTLSDRRPNKRTPHARGVGESGLGWFSVVSLRPTLAFLGKSR